MKKYEYLIMQTSGEYESLVVAAPWNDDEILKIKQRFKKISKFRDEDADLFSMSFSTDLMVRVRGDWYEDLERKKINYTQRSICPIISSETAKHFFSEKYAERLDFEQMTISVSGSFWYKFGIKHDDALYECFPDFRIEDL